MIIQLLLCCLFCCYGYSFCCFPIGEARGFCFPPCMADLFCRRNICQSFSIANFKTFFKRLVELENCGLAHLI